MSAANYNDAGGRLIRRSLPSILLVDPDLASAQALTQPLAGQFITAIVPSGQAAGAALSHLLPTFVVTELDLPDGSGLELIRALRNSPATQRILLIALTRRATVNDKIAVFQAGADDFLVKPITPDAFATHMRLVARFDRVFPR